MKAEKVKVIEKNDSLKYKRECPYFTGGGGFVSLITHLI